MEDIATRPVWLQHRLLVSYMEDMVSEMNERCPLSRLYLGSQPLDPRSIGLFGPPAARPLGCPPSRPVAPISTGLLEISGPPNGHFHNWPNDRHLRHPLRTISIIFTLTISTCGCSTYAGNCAAYGTTARQVGGPARRPRRGSPSQKRQHPLGGAASGQSAFTYHRDPKVQTSGRQKEVVFLRGICFTCGK